MTKIALLGAGGKMGVRLARNLVTSRYEVAPVEIAPEGRERLRAALGLEAVPLDTALAGSAVVILAVPDRLFGTVCRDLVDRLAPGTAVIVLDAAAPYAGELPERADITYFCTHPCHPALFDFTPDLEAQRDFFGGISGPQGIVCALIQGPEAHYALCEEVARVIFSPVARAHRCTLEQIAIREPALSETVGATLALALRSATDRAVAMGVPRAAATDFTLGHLKIELGIAFEVFAEGRFSDGALLAIAEAQPVIFREGWLDRVFDRGEILRSVRAICNPGARLQ